MSSPEAMAESGEGTTTPGMNKMIQLLMLEK